MRPCAHGAGFGFAPCKHAPCARMCMEKAKAPEWRRLAKEPRPRLQHALAPAQSPALFQNGRGAAEASAEQPRAETRKDAATTAGPVQQSAQARRGRHAASAGRASVNTRSSSQAVAVTQSLTHAIHAPAAVVGVPSRSPCAAHQSRPRAKEPAAGQWDTSRRSRWMCAVPMRRG